LFKIRRPESTKEIKHNEKINSKTQVSKNNSKNEKKKIFYKSKSELGNINSKEIDFENIVNKNNENQEILKNDFSFANKNVEEKKPNINKQIFINKIGAKSLDIIFDKNKSILNCTEKKCSINYNDSYLEKLQNNLKKKIKEKKVLKMSSGINYIFKLLFRLCFLIVNKLKHKNI